MAANQPTPFFPSELVRAVSLVAIRDAKNVGFFLRALGFQLQDLRLPVRFMLELGAALRLVIWEGLGLRVHLEAGLPSAHDLLVCIFREVLSVDYKNPDGTNPPLLNKVLRLVIERFAWAGPQDLGADLVLGEAEEEQLVEILATLVWNHRQSRPATGGPRHAEA